jgi:N6-L-threonylcarbamoyladenine synthase
MVKKVIGIETSCDETAVAIVDENKNILAHKVLSQLDEHAAYGGVVPEIASRCHIKYLHNLVSETLAEAKLDLDEIDAVAVTAGPGLIGGVLVGVMVAKAIAASLNKPFIAVNHLEGHALTPRLVEDVPFPYLLLLVSGGHCQQLIVQGVGQYQLLGSTIDDAVGEAFDKVAKMLGLPYPGGPAVEKLAKEGNPKRFKLPQPLRVRGNCDFSFSGLKTAVLRKIEALGGTPTEQDRADICASFQHTVTEILTFKIEQAMAHYLKQHSKDRRLVIAGGVAANQHIKQGLMQLCQKQGFSLHVPPIQLCTDNGAMIAWAGMEKFLLGKSDPLTFAPRSRWPLSTSS